jgi:ABC-type nitrate/sulfonate/bicarbonate transport system substrate-binding protein
MNLLAAASSFLVVLAVIVPTRWASAAKLRIGYSAITATMAPLWNAYEKGLFAKYGFDAELIYLAGGSRIALALEADSIQLAQLNLNAAVEARLAGGSVMLVGSVYDTYYFQIFGKPSITNTAQLKGKVIAASSAGAASEYGIRDGLESVGLKETDYKILYVGGTDARVQSLQQGLADAAIISPPNGLIAQKLGFREIMNLIEMKIPFGYGALAAKESWLRQNRPTAINFFKAYLESHLCVRMFRPPSALSANTRALVTGKFSKKAIAAVSRIFRLGPTSIRRLSHAHSNCRAEMQRAAPNRNISTTTVLSESWTIPDLSAHCLANGSPVFR